MKKFIRKISSIIHRLPTGKTFRFVTKQTGNTTKAAQAGLGGMSLGEARLPGAIGPATRFNAFGKSIKLKQLPKKNKHTHSILLSFKPWGRGPTQTKLVDFYRDCYQTEAITPPAMELALINEKGENYYGTPSFNLTLSSEEEVVLAVNVLLEIFGDFEVLVLGEGVREAKYTRVNWKIIPPGEQPFEYLMKHVRSNVSKPSQLPVVEGRQEYLNNHKPDQIFVGNGGFSDYLAYQFTDKNLVILESMKFGNATYVFRDDWKEFSKLTKKEIIADQLAAARIVHTSSWQDQVNSLLE